MSAAVRIDPSGQVSPKRFKELHNVLFAAPSPSLARRSRTKKCLIYIYVAAPVLGGPEI